MNSSSAPATTPSEATRGRLRRRILLKADGVSGFAALEDDYHCMEVRVQHDGERVTGVEAGMSRHPLTICPEATAPLQAFVGTRLGVRPVHEIEAIDPRWQCTHLYDLMVLLVAQAARGGERRYELDILDPSGGQVTATLLRDGSPRLRWHMLRGTLITAPSRYAGLDVRQLASWAIRAADADELEAVRVLRRGMLIAGGRRIPIATEPHAGVPRAAKALAGACHSFQPINIVRAREVFGNRQDFTDRQHDLLREYPFPTPQDSSKDSS